MVFKGDFSEKIIKESEVDILNSQTSKELTLTKIQVSGGLFSDRYYHKLFGPLLQDSSIDLKDLHKELTLVERNLESTGLFGDVKVKVDLDSAVAPTILNGQSSLQPPLPAVAKIELVPKSYNVWSSYSNTSDSYLKAGARFLNPNFLENAACLLADINFSYDPVRNVLNQKIWNFDLSVPLPRNASIKTVFSPSISLIDSQAWASHDQVTTGVLFGVKKDICKLSELVTGITLTNRRITNVGNGAADIIRTDAGDDVKVALESRFLFDSRKYQDKFPLNGSLLKISGEWAGFDSVDTISSEINEHKKKELNTFFKGGLSFQGTKSFLDNTITTSLDFQAGSILASKSNKDKIHVADRFFLGGINSLKGFELNSVGLKEDSDYIGGTSFFKTNLSFYTRIPNTKITSPLRLYSFFNFGDNYDFKSLDEAKKLFFSQDFINKSAIASGVGLLYKSNNAVLDLTYSFPLSTRGQDTAKPRLAFGLSLNFF